MEIVRLSPEVWVALALARLTLPTSAIVVPFVTMARTFLREPLRLRRIMAKQGVNGAPFRLFFGNSPECYAYDQSFPGSLPTVTPQDALHFAPFGKLYLNFRLKRR